jgi:UDP-N-acetylmuramate: L-alanyl-gamma-D-glutamyl-meso-diaminopimelate ligase
MSTQLEALGIELIEGFEADQLDLDPDIVVIGNVMSRGMPVIEALLDRGIPYSSGPEWLSRELLRERWVIAVAGTHGKTTTTSLLAWILEDAGLSPGFLIGGVPGNFPVSARLGNAPFFVIEADEYDTAFFDKRAKFVHYRPRTLILNNLEFDHADIYPDLAAIERQFQHLLRLVPGNGRVVLQASDAALARVVAAGCWTPVEKFARQGGDQGDVQGDNKRGERVLWSAKAGEGSDFSQFEVLLGGHSQGEVRWPLIGAHNVDNALAAIAAARHAGVPVDKSIEALGRFRGVRRRMELRGTVAGVSVYDDFAHHPTAIRTTLDGLRRRAGSARIVAVLEPRSATMKQGVHSAQLADSLSGADAVFLYAPPTLGWDVRGAVQSLGAKAQVANDMDALLASVLGAVRAGDQLLIMSNGGFGGLHTRVLEGLAARAA